MQMRIEAKQDSNNSDITTRTLKGIHSQSLIVVIRGVSSLVYFSIMSRLLTPNDFGYYALILAVTNVLNSLSEAGLGSSVIQKKDISRDFASTAFTLSLCLGIFFSLLLFLFAAPFSNLVCSSGTLTIAFRIMSSIIFIQAVNNITWSLYMRKLDFFKFGILQVIAESLSYLVGFWFAFNSYGFYSIVAVAVSNQLFLSAILAILKKYQFRIIIIKSYIREIISYGGWLTAAVIVRNLTDEIDKVIIGRMLPIADLGAINRPQGFVNRISSQVNGIFDTVLFPILSSIQDDSHRIGRAYIKIISIATAVSLFLGGCLSLGSKLIIDIFFGPQWEHLRPILIIFSLALVVNGYSRMADSFFRSLGIVKQYFFARLVNWIVFITAVWIGCHYGILGATIGMVSGSILSCIVKYLMQCNSIKISTKDIIRSIARNIVFILGILIISLLIMFYLPLGEYFGLIFFIAISAITIVLFPNLYGRIFRETIIDRYFSFTKKYRLF